VTIIKELVFIFKKALQNLLRQQLRDNHLFQMRESDRKIDYALMDCITGLWSKIKRTDWATGFVYAAIDGGPTLQTSAESIFGDRSCQDCKCYRDLKSPSFTSVSLM